MERKLSIQPPQKLQEFPICLSLPEECLFFAPVPAHPRSTQSGRLRQIAAAKKSGCPGLVAEFRKRKNAQSFELTVGTPQDIGLHRGFVAMVVSIGLDREKFCAAQSNVDYFSVSFADSEAVEIGRAHV